MPLICNVGEITEFQDIFDTEKLAELEQPGILMISGVTYLQM